MHQAIRGVFLTRTGQSRRPRRPLALVALARLIAPLAPLPLVLAALLALGGHLAVSQAQEQRLARALRGDAWLAAPATEERRRQFMELVNTLASDAFGGREPGTEGGRRTTALLARRFEALGLMPLAGYREFLLPVSLSRVRTQARLSVGASTTGSDPRALANETYVAWLSGHRRELRLSGTPLFVGYGIQAPEYDWDDYKGVDARGKIVVMLLGEPESDPTGDPAFFDAALLTRHGRWDHKLAIAARQGAAAAILLHDSAVAGYPFTAVRNTYGVERLNLSDPKTARHEPPVSIWLSETGTRQLLETSGVSVEQLLVAARSGNAHKTRKPMQLANKVHIEASALWHDFVSHNVAGRLPAHAGTTSPPSSPIVLTAHWDHLGRLPASETKSGDAPSWYPGAADNAAGVAQMLDVAGMLADIPLPRDVIFAAVTAEESGLLGARHLVAQLNADSQRPLAALNIDVANVFGRSRDVEVIGLGLSSLDDALQTAARSMQRTVSPDYAPALGRIFRSDQDEFLQQGIPAVWIRGGRQKRPWALAGPMRNIRRYLREGYHQRGDTPRSWWVVDAALEDANLIAEVTRELAASTEPPSLYRPAAVQRADGS